MFSLLARKGRKPHRIIAIHIPSDMKNDIEKMYADMGYTHLVWQREDRRNTKPEEHPE